MTFRFTIRDLLWLTVVVATALGLGLGWWRDHHAIKARTAALVEHAKALHEEMSVARSNLTDENPTFMRVPYWPILDDPIPEP